MLISLSCAWVAGIYLGSSLKLPWLLSLAGFLPLFLLFFTRRHRRPLIMASLVLFAFLGAAIYSYPRLHEIDEGTLRFYNDRGVFQVKGMVAGDPDIRDKSTRLELAVTEINLGGGWRGVGGAALLFVPRYPAYAYGDMLLVSGELETPPQLDDFDYRGYLSYRGIYTTMFYPKIERLETGQGSALLAGIYSLRAHLAESLGRVLPEPQASLARGMVLGMRGSIPQSLNDAFARSGTTHLLAISGLNLSIMAGVLLGIGIWLFGRRHYLYVWLALGVIWFYTLITGVQAPVVRGAIMASLFLVAELFGRQRNAIVALPFAAAVMVGLSPYILGDAAFQLSFLSMAGLVFIAPIFQGLGRRAVAAGLGEGGVAAAANTVVDGLSTTLGAIIAVWPVVAYHFGIISLVAPLATLLALPAVAGIIVIGALAAVLGLVALPLAQAVGWLAWLFISYLMLVTSGLAAPSLASVAGSVSPAFILGYYPALAAALWLYRYRERWLGRLSGAVVRLKGMSTPLNLARYWKWVMVPLVVGAVLLSYTAATMPDGNLRVSFLDVGQGDAILIQQGSQQVLVDGGPSPQALKLALGRQMPFWDRTIEFVVLTHPHQDHLGGLVEVLRDYRVGQVLYSDVEYTSPLYDEWRRLIEERGIKRTIARAGQEIDLGEGALIRVLWPPATPLLGTDSDIDNNSLVLRLGRGDVSFLLAADIMKEAEWGLMGGRAGLASTVLKVAHHGSDTSTTPGFLAVASPRVAVISVGAGNSFGLPDAGVITRLEEKVGPGHIYRTDRDGTIEFITDGERLWVERGG